MLCHALSIVEESSEAGGTLLEELEGAGGVGGGRNAADGNLGWSEVEGDEAALRMLTASCSGGRC